MKQKIFYNGETKEEIHSRIKNKHEHLLTEEDRVWLRLEQLNNNPDELAILLESIGLVKK